MNEHLITYQRDTMYKHLFRPVCSCGWGMGGFCGKGLAVDYAKKHLDDENLHEHRLSE